jgi:NADH-quinone oxidoreductase subunit G
LSETLGQKLPYDSLDALRGAMYGQCPHFAAIDAIAPADPAEVAAVADAGAAVDKGGFASPVTDFYLTNPIARASRIMAECSALFTGNPQAGTGTHG